MREIWKDVVGYEGLYQISSVGRVKSLERTIEKENNYNAHIKEKFLKNGTFTNGYEYARLFKDKQVKNKLIHRLIAEAFISNEQNLPCVNHMDENKRNNVVGNLEWCTHSYNNNYGTGKARRSASTDYVKIAEFNKKPIIQISILNGKTKRWGSSVEAEMFFSGKATGNISKCLRGKSPKSYGYKWEYAEVQNG